MKRGGKNEKEMKKGEEKVKNENFRRQMAECICRSGRGKKS